MALAFKGGAGTARHGLELGQLRLQGCDAELESGPYHVAATTTAVMNTRIGATNTTASASHNPAHKNVPATAMTVPAATPATMTSGRPVREARHRPVAGSNTGLSGGGVGGSSPPKSAAGNCAAYRWRRLLGGCGRSWRAVWARPPRLPYKQQVPRRAARPTTA